MALSFIRYVKMKNFLFGFSQCLLVFMNQSRNFVNDLECLFLCHFQLPAKNMLLFGEKIFQTSFLF